MSDLPSHFGPYQIISPLGAGGMGQVYRARDTRLQRFVAIKILHDRAARDSDRQRRFAQEAVAASALNHPNILTVYDVGTERDTQYLVSELIDGVSLRTEMNRGRLPLRRILEAGYFVTPSIRAFGMLNAQRTHGGIDFPLTGQPGLPPELRPVHDVIQRVNYVNLGAGLAYSVNDSFDLFGSFLREATGRNGHMLNRGVTIGASWSFSRKSKGDVVTAGTGAPCRVRTSPGSRRWSAIASRISDTRDGKLLSETKVPASERQSFAL